MNEHLISTPPPSGDKTTAVTINLAGFVPSSGGSGLVEPGLYELTVRSACWVPKKNGGGVNLDVSAVISGPGRQAGVPIRETHPAPVGDEATNKGFKFVPAMIVSSMSGDPEKLKARMAPGAAPINFTPGSLEGKKLWVELEVDEYEGKQKSKVKGYIQKAEYDARPGPFNSAPAGAVATSAVQPAQKTVPEVAPAAAAAPAAASAAKAAATAVLGDW